MPKSFKNNPPKERQFDNYMFELWDGGGIFKKEGKEGFKNKSFALDIAKDIRMFGTRARVVKFGDRYFIYVF